MNLPSGPVSPQPAMTIDTTEIITANAIDTFLCIPLRINSIIRLLVGKTPKPFHLATRSGDADLGELWTIPTIK